MLISVCCCAELAKAVGKVFVVGCTAESMQQAAAENPDKFITATKGGTLATEEVLEKVEGEDPYPYFRPTDRSG